MVVLREDSAISTKWPLARVTKVYPGKDKLVRVTTVETETGVYACPVTKLAPVLPAEPEYMN